MPYVNLKAIHIGFTDEQKEKLSAIAKDKNMSQSEVVRTLVDYMLANPLETEIALGANEVKKTFQQR